MTVEEKNKKIELLKTAIANYEELDSDMENPEYVARGNGFCDSKYRPCPLLENMVKAGHLGKKSGQGFYQYDENGNRIG